MTATHSTPSFAYDPTYDAWQTYLDPSDPEYVPDSDTGRPIEIYGVGFRNGYAPPLSFGGPSAGPPDFEEGERFCETCSPPTVSGPTDRNVYPLGFGTPDPEDDVSNNVVRYLPLTGGGFDTTPWAVGTSTSGLAPGDPVPTGTLNASAGETFEFVIDGSDPDVDAYLRESLDAGVLEFTIVSMHSAEQGQSTANPSFYTKESADSAAIPPSVEITFHLPEPGAGLGLAVGGLALAALHRRRRPLTSEVA